jgi:hypothetical protein
MRAEDLLTGREYDSILLSKECLGSMVTSK